MEHKQPNLTEPYKQAHNDPSTKYHVYPPPQEYGPNTFTAKPAFYNNVSKLSRTDKKNIVKSIALSLKKELATEKKKDITPANMKTMYKDADVVGEIKKLREDLGAGVRSKDLEPYGMNFTQKNAIDKDIFAVENELIADKIGNGFVPSGANLRILKQQLGIPADYPNNKFRYLILLDDWAQIKDQIMSGVKTYGPKIIDMIFEKYFGKPLFGGQDWGGSYIDYDKVKPTAMYKKAIIEGVTKADNTPSPVILSNTHKINSDYIRTILCPESFKSRNNTSTFATVVYASEMVYTLTSTSTGTAFFLVNPHRVLSDASTPEGTFVFLNPTSYVTSTGAVSGGTYEPGPLDSVTGCTLGRIVGCSVQVIPTLSSNNNSGNFAMWTLEGINNTDVTFANISSDAAGQGSNDYVTGNLNSSFRRAMYPEIDARFDSGTITESPNSFIIVQGTGLPVSANVAKVVVYYVAEGVLLPATNKYAEVAFQPYSATTQEYATKLRALRSPFMLQEVDVKKMLAKTLVASFDNTVESWDSIISSYHKPISKSAMLNHALIPNSMSNNSFIDYADDLDA